MRTFIYFAIVFIIGGFGTGLGFSFRGEGMLNRASLPVLAQELTENNTHHSTTMDVHTYDAFFNADPNPDAVSDSVYSAVLPHHLLAGRFEANFFKAMRDQKPPVVVLIGPNHPQAGKNNIVTGLFSWRTPYGELAVNTTLIGKLTKELTTSSGCPALTNGGRGSLDSCKSVVAIDDELIGHEHSIGAVVPFIKHTWPNTTLVPLIIKDRTSNSEIDALVAELKNSLPAHSIVIASVDFSHYLPESVAAFHDELSINVLATGDRARLPKVEVDSIPSLYFLLSYNALGSAQNFHLVSHTNSATIIGKADIEETTSHVIGYYTAGAPTESPLTSVQFFGDIMIDRNVAKNMATSGLDYVFQNLRGEENRFFRGADLFVPNLEGPFAPKRIQTSKSIAFRFDPKWINQFKKYNISAVSLANNHTYDMGRANVDFTRTLLASAGIGYFGDQLREGPAYTWISTTTPQKVAFIGVENVTHDPSTSSIKRAIDDAKGKADFVIVFCHAGTEYRRTSTVKQQKLYRWLIDMGANAVVAAHPHVVEETEMYKDKPIIYSMGNFVFDQYFSKDTQEGLSIGFVIKDNAVKKIYFFPTYSEVSQNALMKSERRDEFLQWMSDTSRLGDRAIENGVISL